LNHEASKVVAITEEAIAAFVAISGDKNPIHSDESYAATTIFKRRIAPGIMIASYISAVIANDFPGPGSIYLSQNLRFQSPVFIGDEITVVVRLVARPRPDRVSLETLCFNQHGMPVLTGDALVKVSNQADI